MLLPKNIYTVFPPHELLHIHLLPDHLPVLERNHLFSGVNNHRIGLTCLNTHFTPYQGRIALRSIRVSIYPEGRSQHPHIPERRLHDKRLLALHHVKKSFSFQYNLPLLSHERYRVFQPGLGIHPHLRPVIQRDDTLSSSRNLQFIINNFGRHPFRLVRNLPVLVFYIHTLLFQHVRTRLRHLDLGPVS